jgi:predicted AlkP superfamily phosphohydrolase/phosphomutase
MIRNRLQATEYLLGKIPWDFFMVVFTAGDRVQHALWKYTDPDYPQNTGAEAGKYRDSILWVYQELDKAVGEIVKAVGDNTNIVIMSDHGADVLYKTVSLNYWLLDKGLLALNSKRNNFKYLFSSFMNISDSLKQIFLPKSHKTTGRFFETIDWSKTKAFFIGAAGKIFINQKGKFPQGIVEAGSEYEKVRDELTEELMTLKDPNTGKTVVEKVLKRENVYQGDCFAYAPDLVIVWKKGYNSVVRMEEIRKGIRPDKEGDIFNPHRRMSADHDPHGIFIIKSSYIEENKKNLAANIMDLCPTVLYLMNTPIPKSMDGRVLTEVFKESFLKDRTINYSQEGDIEDKIAEAPGYSAEEAKKIEERLKGLGYLE